MSYQFEFKGLANYQTMIIELINTFTEGPAVGVEIGVREGFTSREIIKNCTINKLYSIDPWIAGYFPDEKHKLDQDHYEALCANANEVLSPYKQSVILRKKAEDAVDDVPNELDFIFIDGDHCSEAVRKDMELWIPKVRAGGLVIGDDWWGRYPDVATEVIRYVNSHDPFIAPFGVGGYDKFGFSQSHCGAPSTPKRPFAINKACSQFNHIWWAIKK